MSRISVATAVAACLMSGAVLACDDHAMSDDHLGMAPAATQKPLVVQQAAAKPQAASAAKAKVTKVNAKPVTAPAARMQLTKEAGSSGG